MFVHFFLSSICLFHPGVEEPEAEAGWELPEDHVLPGSPLPDVHAAEDAKHGPGHGGKSERPAPRPLQVSQRDEGPTRLPDLQIRHVLPEELKQTRYLSPRPFSLLLLLTKPLLLVCLGCCVTRACDKLCSFRVTEAHFKTWNLTRNIYILHQSLQTQAPSPPPTPYVFLCYSTFFCK